MYSASYCCQIFMKPEFLDRFLKITQILNFIKIRPVGADHSMRTDGHTEIHDEANGRFSQFCESS